MSKVEKLSQLGPERKPEPPICENSFGKTKAHRLFLRRKGAWDKGYNIRRPLFGRGNFMSQPENRARLWKCVWKVFFKKTISRF